MGRRRLYFVMMGSCLTLITLAWLVVRLFSVTAAIAMSVVAMVIPPLAVMIASPPGRGGGTGDYGPRR